VNRGVDLGGRRISKKKNLFLAPASKKEDASPEDVQARLQDLKALTERQQDAIAQLEAALQREAP
jgi:hypothetical protein